ncbi:MAG TPA: hypothetical protein VHS09_00825 [Polyangiaceae bacterium]|nr:hypothetical protein [Polyangiaceae bacterium]
MIDRLAVHAAVDALLDALDEYRRAPVEEELVRVRDLPLEAKARAALVASGRLRVVRIGRETWTLRRWLVEAVESMPRPTSVEAVDDLTEAARKSAARRSAA